MLASASLGDIQLSMCDRKTNLEVEVIRARDLQARPGSRVLPGGSKAVVGRSSGMVPPFWAPDWAITPHLSDPIADTTMATEIQ